MFSPSSVYVRMGSRSVTCLLMGLALWLAAPREVRADDTINAVLGDASWATAFGGTPDRADEITRIRTHLTFVLHLLRARDLSAFSGSARAHRRAGLHALGRYIERGEFPRRTRDPYAGRRPRFIDDRGVHCAVGQVIADSGAAELAHAIDEKHEYAYVNEMTSTALEAWAATHGFTVDELAMIQPTYGEPPPSPHRTRELIERSRESITLMCARRARASTKVSLRVTGDKRGHVRVKTSSTGPFATCVAETASMFAKPDDAGAYSIEPFTFEMQLELPDPGELFARAMDVTTVPRDCTPRPGNLAREATIDVTSNKEAFVVRVTTTPANPEVNACAERQLTKSLQRFGAGAWSLHARRTHTIKPRFTDARLASSLQLAGPTYATRCYPAKDPPARLTITIAAKPDDARFAIGLDAGDATFKRCVRELLQTYLRTANSVTRRVDSSPPEAYFRIDAPVKASATFDVRPPAPPPKR